MNFESSDEEIKKFLQRYLQFGAYKMLKRRRLRFNRFNTWRIKRLYTRLSVKFFLRLEYGRGLIN